MADQAHALRELMKTQTPELPTTQQQQNRTRIISIASGKGGVGKTNISVNLALSLASHGLRVILMDADFGLANVNVILGVVPEYNLYHIISNKKTINDILISTDYGLQIIAGASGFSKIANLREEDRDRLLSELVNLSFADIIIIDLSAGVTKNVISFIEASDETIIVTTPEPTAVTDAYGIVKIIATDACIGSKHLQLVVNRVSSVAEGRGVADRFRKIATMFLNLQINYLGYVHDDKLVSQSVLQRRPFILAHPKCKAAHCIDQIAQRLGRIESGNEHGVILFFKKLLGQKKRGLS